MPVDNINISKKKTQQKHSLNSTKKRRKYLFPKFYKHDEFCKDAFLDLEVARNVLRCVLSVSILAEIVIEKLELVETTFINKFLHPLYADIIYRVPLKNKENTYVYLLLDFKSDNGYGTVAQLFRYSFNMSMRLSGLEPKQSKKQNKKQKNSQKRKNKKISFPCIISIVFHCGKSKFTAPANIADIIDLPNDSKLRENVINYKLVIFDLNAITEDKFPETQDVNLLFYVLKMARSKKVNEQATKLFMTIKDALRNNKSLTNLWDKCLYYLFTSAKYFTRETHENLINLTKKLGVKTIMSQSAAKLYYKEAMTIGKTKGIAIGEIRGIAKGETRGLTKGIAIGETRGIAKGETRGIARAIIRLLTCRFEEPSARLQKKIMGIQSEAKLEELLDFAASCVSIGEFATALR
ncbi:MAG: Rpn family recombination-promoting nuclease/putative transposase [Planctomycetaceae bacterium]|nr:Rpn family recombination-promoting nuclease/putative transposase [Planctomycetaceae bacterium]